MITIAPPTLADTYAALDAALDPPADDGPPLVLVEAPTETPPESLVDDLANVLTLVDRVFVGPLDVRREIARVLARYADEELVDIVIPAQAPAAEAREYLPSKPHGTYRKEICYDRESHDYAMYLDNELVGFQRTYREAEITLDQIVYELMTGMYFRKTT